MVRPRLTRINCGACHELQNASTGDVNRRTTRGAVMEVTTQAHSTVDEAPICPTEADETARWEWLAVIGSGLIAAAITAIAVPSVAQDGAATPPSTQAAAEASAR